MCVCVCVRSSAVPEFRALVGNEAAEELQCSMGDAVHTGQTLKKCFTRMMNCEKKVFVDQLNMLVKRVTEEGEQADRCSWWSSQQQKTNAQFYIYSLSLAS